MSGEQLSDGRAAWHGRQSVRPLMERDQSFTTWVLELGLFASVGDHPKSRCLPNTPLADLDRDALVDLSLLRARAGRLDLGASPPCAISLIDFQGGRLPAEPVPPALRASLAAKPDLSDGVETVRRLVAQDLEAAAAAILHDPLSDCRGLLVRSGSWFGYARDRTEPISPAIPLTEQVRGCATKADAVALLDCEVSVGCIDHGGWVITASTLPHRVGQSPRPELCGSMLDRLYTHDAAPDGQTFPRTWHITEAAGLLHTLSAIETRRPGR